MLQHATICHRVPIITHAERDDGSVIDDILSAEGVDARTGDRTHDRNPDLGYHVEIAKMDAFMQIRCPAASSTTP